jgi:hypothetical protein
MRIQEIYEITKAEIENGIDLYEYVNIMYGLLKEEDYEALEGIRLAIADFGMEFIIPENDDEMENFQKYISMKNC